MQTYIGTPTSRIDGPDKVTGAAKYAGEFNVPGLAYGSVVTSTIAKGRIRRIDTSDALRVEGVIEVLTHENRPPMASADSAADMSDAHAMGWRTFRVRNAAELAVKGLEVVCPASKEAGYKTNCATCKACGGLEAKAKASIVIVAHGATAKRHNALLAA